MGITSKATAMIISTLEVDKPDEPADGDSDSVKHKNGSLLGKNFS